MILGGLGTGGVGMEGEGTVVVKVRWVLPV